MPSAAETRANEAAAAKETARVKTDSKTEIPRIEKIELRFEDRGSSETEAILLRFTRQSRRTLTAYAMRHCAAIENGAETCRTWHLPGPL